jgi:cyclophilin family peptidyl-prolyl cis-trans isomerase
LIGLKANQYKTDLKEEKMIRRLIAVALSLAFVTGLAFAQEKTAQTEKKVEKKMEKKNQIVEMQTNYGNIYLEVLQKETPLHAANFLAKVDAHKYDSLTFHRVVPGFVIQGGDPTGSGSGNMGHESMPDEKSPAPPEIRGTVAMARSGLGASDCQFFINLQDNTRLDGMKFTTFAKVVKGMDVVDKITAVKLNGESPVQPVIMTKVQRVDKIPTTAEKAKNPSTGESKK